MRESDRLLDQPEGLDEPEFLGEPGVVERRRRERPEMLALLESNADLPPPAGARGGAAVPIAAVLGIPGENPPGGLHAHADAYHLLHRVVEVPGGDPERDVLAGLGLPAMRREFGRAGAGRRPG